MPLFAMESGLFKVCRKDDPDFVYTVYAVDRMKNGHAQFLIFSAILQQWSWVEANFYMPC